MLESLRRAFLSKSFQLSDSRQQFLPDCYLLDMNTFH
jgi:hypothetical protein